MEEDIFDEDDPPVYQDFIDNINDLKERLGVNTTEVAEETSDDINIFDEFRRQAGGGDDDPWADGTEIDIC